MEAIQELSRRRLLNFTEYTNPHYRPAWFHRVVCQVLDKFMRGEIPRLILVMPPQHGKTELVSRRLPALALGRNPDEKFIAASYSGDLASTINLDVQRIIDSLEYQQLFPNTRLMSPETRDLLPKSMRHKTWIRNTVEFEVVARRGYYKCAGVRGPLTGRTGTMGVIDDPFKDWEDATSAAIREKVFTWYQSVFYTRLSRHAPICIMHTRWHDEDLVGRLQELVKIDPDADHWYIVHFPAVQDVDPSEMDPRAIGEGLWLEPPSPAAGDGSRYRTLRANLGTFVFTALYQGRPSPLQGRIFKQTDWRFWHYPGMPLPPVEIRTEAGVVVQLTVAPLPTVFDDALQSWDCAFKGLNDSDFVVGQAWKRRSADRFLIDQIREQMGVKGTLSAMRQMSLKHPEIVTKLVEDKANGPAVVELLESEIEGLIAVNPEGGKEARAIATQPLQEAGNLYLPHPAIAPWVWQFMAEHAAFPAGANDDQVDSNTQAQARFQKTMNLAGNTFRRDWFQIVETQHGRYPEQLVRLRVRYWRRAASEGLGSDPTIGLCVVVATSGRIIVEDVISVQQSRGAVNDLVWAVTGDSSKRQALEAAGITDCDPVGTMVLMEEDGGPAGQVQADALLSEARRRGARMRVLKRPQRADLVPLATAVSSAASSGNMTLVKAPWNDSFLIEHARYSTEKPEGPQVEVLAIVYDALMDYVKRGFFHVGRDR